MGGRGTNPFPSSYWNEAVIELKKFQGADTEYAENFRTASTLSFEFAFRHDDCAWKKIPRMLVAMHQEGTSLFGYEAIALVRFLRVQTD